MIILDGWGYCCDNDYCNAVRQARTPTLDSLFAQYPHTLLEASGEAVGLVAGQMGNSNVGHLNIGAGRIVYQDIARINRALADGSLARSPVVQQILSAARDNTLHLMGLVSDGGVHSHIDHLTGLLRLAHQARVPRVCVHAFLDGRDVPPQSARPYLQEVEALLQELGYPPVASIMGRYWAMDRDQRWDRVERAFQVLVHGQGRLAASAGQGLQAAYANGEMDEFVAPTVITKEDQPVGTIQDGDVVFFFNFRADRAREISQAFVKDDFQGFARRRPHIKYFTMTQYEPELAVPCVFAPQILDNTLGEVVAQNGLRQLRVAETEKYAHVTYFFNGGREEPFAGEERCLIPSPPVSTYDQQPEMSAAGVAKAAVAGIASGSYGLVVVNLANCDMVGHTGIMPAAVAAVAAVDKAVNEIVAAAQAAGSVVMLFGDHGNAELMVNEETGQPHTAHTNNPVPFVLIGQPAQLRNGILADIAPTALQLMKLPIPAQMTGRSLII
ncbi:MAG: 2,3-bisphosphoglycerate-independent phosphoglycerate mutase [Bacillota bacterium]